MVQGQGAAAGLPSCFLMVNAVDDVVDVADAANAVDAL